MKMREKMDELIEEMLNGKILLGEATAEFEKLYIQKALERNDDHISNTAEVLGIHRNTISKRLASYQEKTKPKKLTAKRSA